jgi:hypothetical protein
VDELLPGAGQPSAVTPSLGRMDRGDERDGAQVSKDRSRIRHQPVVSVQDVSGTLCKLVHGSVDQRDVERESPRDHVVERRRIALDANDPDALLHLFRGSARVSPRVHADVVARQGEMPR